MIILLIIIGISVLILVHELGHFLAAKLSGVPVEEFGIGYPPRIFSKKIGETRYSINLLPFGGFVKIHGEQQIEKEQREIDEVRAFYNQPTWRRVSILSAGVIMNFILGWFIFSSLFFFGTVSAIIVSQVLPDSPAAKAGLIAGDQIIGFDKAQTFINFVNENRGKEINLKIKREDREIIINAVPRAEVLADQGALGIGIGQTGFPKLGFFASLKEGFTTSIAIVLQLFQAIFNLVVGIFTDSRILEGVVGPVGIFQIAAKAAQTGLVYFLQLLGFITINLAVLNILPIPALDGGRLLFIIIEKIKGSRLPIKQEALANAIGFAILLLLMFAITIRDITRLF
jgi:regulator of sigma E protease